MGQFYKLVTLMVEVGGNGPRRDRAAISARVYRHLYQMSIITITESVMITIRMQYTRWIMTIII